jgi:hypothetical protein
VKSVVVHTDGIGFTVGNSTVQCRAFEGNQACIAMTQPSPFTPHKRHISTKWHWFLNQIGEAKGIVMEYIESHCQQANILTKGLDRKVFAPLHDCVMGWTLQDPLPPAKKTMDGSTATCFNPRGVLYISSVNKTGTGTTHSDSNVGSICPSAQDTTLGAQATTLGPSAQDTTVGAAQATTLGTT